jgi:hypothetical protein
MTCCASEEGLFSINYGALQDTGEHDILPISMRKDARPKFCVRSLTVHTGFLVTGNILLQDWLVTVPGQTMVDRFTSYAPTRTSHLALSRRTDMTMEILDRSIRGSTVGTI